METGRDSPSSLTQQRRLPVCWANAIWRCDFQGCRHRGGEGCKVPPALCGLSPEITCLYCSLSIPCIRLVTWCGGCGGKVCKKYQECVDVEWVPSLSPYPTSNHRNKINTSSWWMRTRTVNQKDYWDRESGVTNKPIKNWGSELSEEQ